MDPQLAQAGWLKGPQRAIYDWAKAAGRVRTLISGTTASEHARRNVPPPQNPHSRRSRRTVCSPPYGGSPRPPRACWATLWRWDTP